MACYLCPLIYALSFRCAFPSAPCSSIHDDFYGARDSLLSSRIQEQTGQLETKLQVG